MKDPDYVRCSYFNINSFRLQMNLTVYLYFHYLFLMIIYCSYPKAEDLYL